MKKILISLLLLFMFVTPSFAENKPTDVTSKIQYLRINNQINASTIALKCGDYYYGVVVEDSVNFNNTNNYFVTSGGLTVTVTNEELKSGINKENGFQSIQEIEKGVFLIVSGQDEEQVSKVFKSVFKTPEAVYEMFGHNISPEWTKEIIITPTVVSFSNGSDTIYIYQNKGSISENSYKNKIQPTVFMKELRGIGIPVTYPEDVEGVKNYVPYGTQRYNHYVTHGFTPYAAYDDKAGYIILAKDDDTLKDLFELSSSLTQPLTEIELKTSSASLYRFEPDTYNLDEVMEYAKEVINSDNRYHFGVIQEGDGKQKKYYFDAFWLQDELQENEGMDDNMKGVFVRPSIRTINYLYNVHGNTKQMTGLKTDYSVAGKYAMITNHGASADIGYWNYFPIVSANQLHEFMLEGDYAYLFGDDNLKVYRHVWTVRNNLQYGCDPDADDAICGRDYQPYISWKKYIVQHYNDIRYRDLHQLDTYSCSCISGINTLHQQYQLNSTVKY